MSFDVVTGNVVLDDEKLVDLQRQIGIYHNHAIGYHEGELGVRVRMGWDYYYGRLPAPITPGSSKQIMPVVWNSVNGVLGELQSAFTAGDEVVRFTPLGPEDGIAANLATKMVNKILLHDNDGFNAMSDAFKECLIARNGFVKRYWGKSKKTLIEEFEDLTKDELDIFLANIDGDIVELYTEETKSVEIDEKGKEKEVSKLKNEKPTPKGEEKFKGRVIYEKVTEGVKVEYVPFEEVIIEPTARSMYDANFVAHRVRKTKHELKVMGFDPDIVDALAVTSSDIEAGVIANSRVNNLSPLNVSDTIMTGDNETDKLWLHENYIKTSVLGRDELLQVFTVQNQIIDVNIVNEVPFSTFTPFPIPGSLWGESVYDVTKDLQDLGTSALRLVIDNGINANFRRYVAVKGAYDRQSLMNNRPGSVIEAQSIDAVQPFPHHPLPQGIDLLFNYVDQEKESRTGVNKAGQGLDPAVFKNDNSTATVQMVMTAALNRVRMVARNIAHGGMTDLMLAIYDLVRMNGKEPIMVETAQGMVPVDPKTLPPRNKLTVAVAIGPAEKSERAQKLQTVLMAMTQIPQMGAFLQAGNAYYLATQILESMGIMDVSNYLTPPDQIPQPQPSPQEQMQLALMQEQVKQAGVQTQKMVSEVNLNQSKHEFEQMKAADEMTIRKQESASSQDRMADEHLLNSQKLQLEQRRLDIEQRKLEMKAQEMMIEAQMEARQSRPVAIGR